MKIKTNDQVKILSGKDRGKTGKVIQVFSAENKVVVAGMNLIKKHLRARSQSEKGQVIELSAPMAVSKVALLCPKCQTATRVGYKIEGDKKTRMCRKCKTIVD
ncbi:MAG: 50S ribosomal protein L24 [Candidatus Magasanikbacteria bacterium]|nr:50S ribosomal protein L24 [Candidatus Magasanikbacteria bacterium]